MQMNSHAPLVTFAVPAEARVFRRNAPDGVEVLVTGIGPKAAERAIRSRLRHDTPSLVLTCGFCGGLDPALPPGEVIFAADSDSGTASALRELGVRSATFYCAERIATTAAEKRSLRETTNADAVEMESGVIRRICAEAGIPSATIRVVSDAAEESLPLDFNELTGADGKLRLGALALAVALVPWKIPALIRLGGSSKFAAEKLAEVLGRLLARR